MRPLQSIGMGMVIILLVVGAGDYDVLADPLGWVLVVHGIRSLPREVELRGVLLPLSVLAGLVSVALWLPVVVEALDEADESIAWVANLPQLGCYLLLAHALSVTAGAAGDRAAAGWWRGVVLGLAAVVALPVLIFGGGLTGLEPLAGALVGLVPTVMAVLLFVHSSRPWALAPVDPGTAPRV